MTTLISKNEDSTINFNAVGHKMENGHRLFVADGKETASIEKWLHANGVSAVFFDPADDAENYSNWISQGNCIALFN
jgi:hypothetical protein